GTAFTSAGCSTPASRSSTSEVTAVSTARSLSLLSWLSPDSVGPATSPCGRACAIPASAADEACAEAVASGEEACADGLASAGEACAAAAGAAAAWAKAARAAKKQIASRAVATKPWRARNRSGGSFSVTVPGVYLGRRVRSSLKGYTSPVRGSYLIAPALTGDRGVASFPSRAAPRSGEPLACDLAAA